MFSPHVLQMDDSIRFYPFAFTFECLKGSRFSVRYDFREHFACHCPNPSGVATFVGVHPKLRRIVPEGKRPSQLEPIHELLKVR